jgi:hypothetical protein
MALSTPNFLPFMVLVFKQKRKGDFADVIFGQPIVVDKQAAVKVWSIFRLVSCIRGSLMAEPA